MKKNYMHDELIDNIAIKILKGDYKDGDQLPKEHELCQQFNLSRTSVREGLHSLRNMGLVTTRPKAGTFVSPREDWKVLNETLLQLSAQANIRLFRMNEIEAFRRVIEPNVAAIAAQNANLDDIHTMEKAAKIMMDHCGDDQIDQYNEADLFFHSTLTKATHNAIFIQLEPTLYTAINSSIQITTPLDNPEERYKAAEQHIELVQAIRERDIELARYLMMQMIFNSSRRAITLEKNKDFDSSASQD